MITFLAVCVFDPNAALIKREWKNTFQRIMKSHPSSPTAQGEAAVAWEQPPLHGADPKKDMVSHCPVGCTHKASLPSDIIIEMKVPSLKDALMANVLVVVTLYFSLTESFKIHPILSHIHLSQHKQACEALPRFSLAMLCQAAMECLALDSCYLLTAVSFTGSPQHCSGP